jgi:hypothetical protein
MALLNVEVPHVAVHGDKSDIITNTFIVRVTSPHTVPNSVRVTSGNGAGSVVNDSATGDSVPS